MYDIEYLRKTVKKELSPKRYHHSVCVHKQAMRLARRHGVDSYKAGVAGLLHDICKNMSGRRQLKYLKRSDILLDVLTMEHPGVWHGITGSVYIRQELGIEDEDILAAVRYHTTGRAGMSELEKVVFLADLTSEDRDYPDLEVTRKLARKSLDEGMRYVLTFSIHQLLRKQQVIVQDTWEAYNHYLRLPENGKEEDES